MTAKPRDILPPSDDESDRPLTDDEFARGRSALLTRRARKASGLSQAVFARRYGIPVATLRDWEQGRRVPDRASLSYLRVIERLPEAVARALNDAA
jgi:putative transcriptional regulator